MSITLTKLDIEQVTSEIEQKKKENPWDQEGDDFRLFRAVTADLAMKFSPMVLATTALSMMLLNKDKDAAKNEEEIDKITKSPIIVGTIAQIMHYGYLLGRCDERKAVK